MQSDSLSSPRHHGPPEFDQRSGDRRRNTVISLLYGNWFVRRRGARRGQDQQRGYYVDWYEPHILCLMIAILLLSCADAILTLTLLSLGGRELNVFMATLIHTNVQLFAGGKMAITGAGLLFLVVHHRFRLFRRLHVEHILRLVLLIYFLLVGYELMLLTPARAPNAAVLIVLLSIALSILGLYLHAKRLELINAAAVAAPFSDEHGKGHRE
jgi:hypothetical protein